jgi:hypothetical protein
MIDIDAKTLLSAEALNADGVKAETPVGVWPGVEVPVASAIDTGAGVGVGEAV